MLPILAPARPAKFMSSSQGPRRWGCFSFTDEKQRFREGKRLAQAAGRADVRHTAWQGSGFHCVLPAFRTHRTTR